MNTAATNHAPPRLSARASVRPGLVISHHFQTAGPAQARLVKSAGFLSLRALPEPAWLEACPWVQEKKLIFHWGLGPVSSNFKRAFLREGLGDYLASGRAGLFSFDLGPAARGNLGILPLSPPLTREAIYRHTADAVGFIRRFYRGPLAAENYNYYPTGLYNQVTEPAFIADYLREFDLGLALDLAHGAVTAANLGERPESYFAALPLARTAELHLSRPFLPAPGSGLMAADAHGAPGAREWNWLAFVIGNKEFPAAVPVFVEYYRDLDKLEEMQKRLAVFLTAPGAAGA